MLLSQKNKKITKCIICKKKSNTKCSDCLKPSCSTCLIGTKVKICKNCAQIPEDDIDDDEMDDNDDDDEMNDNDDDETDQ